MITSTAEAGTVLLVDAIGSRGALLFQQPRAIIVCDRLDGVAGALAEVEAAAQGGAHLAGLVAYEAGFAFEPKLAADTLPSPTVPLVWFGIYDSARRLSPGEVSEFLGNGCGTCPSVTDLTFDTSREAYEAAFAAVQRHLAAGDIYQANLTLRARFRFAGDPAALFCRLLARQPVGHAALLNLGHLSVLSLSPELFLERVGPTIRARPMKGTAPRGRTRREDLRAIRELARDPKSQAENVMIVDLMRNDLSRICAPGSVRVPDLFAVETYRTLHQMTSTVEGRLESGAGVAEAFRRLFPCGSITGAPKLRAMEILRDLEKNPRGIYCGAIGHVAPGGDFRFNVAIRTVLIDADSRGEAGTGSGIVFDSGVGPEYDESLLKLRFLTDTTPPFALIETLAWTPDAGYLLLGRHLDRLAESARHLGLPCNLAAVEAALASRAAAFSGPRRVRLELSQDGRFDLTDAALEPPPAEWRVVLVETPTDPADPLLYHKTTRRDLYDGVRRELSAATGCDEVLFTNRYGFVTEGSFTTLFVERDGTLLTPALDHGLLPGTLRAALLETGRAREADLRPGDLEGARIYLGNSVRGLVSIVIQSRSARAEAALRSSATDDVLRPTVRSFG